MAGVGRGMACGRCHGTGTGTAVTGAMGRSLLCTTKVMIMHVPCDKTAAAKRERGAHDSCLRASAAACSDTQCAPASGSPRGCAGGRLWKRTEA